MLMNKLIKLFVALLCVQAIIAFDLPLSFLYPQKKGKIWPIQRTNKVNAFTMPIRVLIDQEVCKTNEWKMQSEKGFIFYHTKIEKNSYTPELHIAIKMIKSRRTGVGEPTLFINGKKQTEKVIYFKPSSGNALYKGNIYKGAFALIVENNELLLVNHLDLEDYVASVLPHEGWPSWSDEFNRALCIVVRTYGIYTLLEERKMRKKKGIVLPYDIRATNFHQTYKGVKDEEKYNRVVDQTRGLILSHQGAPILAMFDACCGGIVPSKIEQFDFDKAPYLKRSYPCTFCQNCKSYSWQAEYTHVEVETALKKEYKKLSKLRDISIDGTDSAGLVQTLKLRIPGAQEITGKKLKSLLKKLKSRAFTLQKKGQIYQFSGFGFGHHLGMCQWGANTLIKNGWSYQEVLKFYYPGATLMRLTKSL